ncbi:MAG: hypothetical protein ACO2O2_02635 [Acidilobaceae archaeon]|jgi:hypothetical protein
MERLCMARVAGVESLLLTLDEMQKMRGKSLAVREALGKVWCNR